jgi:hypothetical protein
MKKVPKFLNVMKLLMRINENNVIKKKCLGINQYFFYIYPVKMDILVQ